MKIIISPSKKMIDSRDSFLPTTEPIFSAEAALLLRNLRSKSRKELKALLKCSDKLTDLNYERYQLDKEKQIKGMALTSYQGLQFQEMAPHIFSDSAWEYVNKHVYILSGLYGLVKPTDGVIQYRLEMQAKLSCNDCTNLYDFWGIKIAMELEKDEDVILNLASKEYSDVIEPYCKNQMITVVFGEVVDNKIKVKGTLAKMARGAMVRYLAEYNISSVEKIKQFSDYGYEYTAKYSTDCEMVFIKKKTNQEVI